MEYRGSRRDVLRAVLAGAGLEILTSRTADAKSVKWYQYWSIPPPETTPLKEAVDDQLALLAQGLGLESEKQRKRYTLESPEEAVISEVVRPTVSVALERTYSREKRLSRVPMRDLQDLTAKEDPVLSKLMSDITLGYSSYQDIAQAALCFVLTAIKFDHEKGRRELERPGRSYVRSPQETLYDGEGDCKDTSVLLASLLRANKDYEKSIPSVYILHPTHIQIGVPAIFKEERINPKVTHEKGIVRYNGEQYVVAETASNLPLYLGGVLSSHKNKDVESIWPSVR